MSAARAVELLEAEERYYRDLIVLLQGLGYRWGRTPERALRALEARRAVAERRLLLERASADC